MMASCTRCQHKFFITRNTFRGDPDGAENYLREKFVRHECPRQSGDAHKILRLWKTDQPHSARMFLETKMTILASAVEDEIHQLVRFQIETFRQPTPLSPSQLYDHHFRAEKIRVLGKELDQICTKRVVEQLKRAS